MKILVTGATGFVGSVLLPQLLDAHGEAAVTAFILPDEPLPPSLQNLPLRIVRGDITDAHAVEAAVVGHTHVVHLAGFISYWKRHRDRLFAVNVGGVENVIAACRNAGVERLVHISSVGAVGFQRNGVPADETVPFNWPRDFYYMTSKYEGQRRVEAAADDGLPAVILNPASIMGPGDPQPRTPHNLLYRRIYSTVLSGSFSGGLAVVDVRDLASIIGKALERGDRGERYLVVGANLTYRDVIRTIAEEAGRPAHPFPIPAPLFSFAGRIMEWVSALTRRPPLLTHAYGRLSGWKTYYDNRKSREAFAHEYIDFRTTVADSCRYFERRFLYRPESTGTAPASSP